MAALAWHLPEGHCLPLEWPWCDYILRLAAWTVAWAGPAYLLLKSLFNDTARVHALSCSLLLFCTLKIVSAGVRRRVPNMPSELYVAEACSWWQLSMPTQHTYFKEKPAIPSWEWDETLSQAVGTLGHRHFKRALILCSLYNM